MISREPIDTYQDIEELSRIDGVILYRAWDPAGKRPVLLQRFLTPLPHEDILADLRWTSKPLATLGRKDVRAISGWGLNAEQQLCLVIEPVEGQPLSTQMAEMAATGRQYEPQQALRLVLSLAHILHAALQVGIVHKALHPQQVILPEDGLEDPDSRPVLLNLDLPATAATSTSTRYQAWEQEHGRAIDGRSNIFSLGVLLYDLLTGTAPDATPRAPLAEARPGLPAPVYEVVNRAIRSIMISRYQTWEEFIAALEQALVAVGAPAGFTAGSNASKALPPLPPVKPNRLPYGLAVLTVLLIAVLTVLAFFEEAQFGPVITPLRDLLASQDESPPAVGAPIPTWPFDFNNFIIHDTATPTATAMPTDPPAVTSTTVPVVTVAATSVASPLPPTPTETAVPPPAPPPPTTVPPTPVPPSPTLPPPPTAVPPTAPPPPPPPSPTSVPPTAPPPPPPPSATPPPPPAPSATAPLPGG